MNFLDAAFDLTRWGWKVFPLMPFAKIPAIAKKDGGNGCLDATDDEETIAGWSRRFPRANIGLATGQPSGVVVIDLDPRNGSDESLARLAKEKRLFPNTVTAKTGNGGLHLYYAFDASLKNSKSALAPGIDVKTTGGYVVAPPSMLEEGKTYSWLASPLGGALPRLPMWVIQALKPKPKPVLVHSSKDTPKDIAKLVDFVAKSGKGDRNNILFWASCRAAEAGLLDQAAKDSLISAAESSGLDKVEAGKTVDSAAKRGKIA